MGMNWSKPLAIATLMATLAAGPVRAETLPDTIRFGAFGQGYGQPFGVALLAIAHVKGFIADEFKDTPVKLEWSYLTGTGPAINEAIANGQLDFAQYGGLPNIIGRANGLPIRRFPLRSARGSVGISELFCRRRRRGCLAGSQRTLRRI